MLPRTLPSPDSSISKPSSRSAGSNLPFLMMRDPNISTRTSPAPRSSTSMPSAPLSSACESVDRDLEVAITAFVHAQPVAIRNAVAVADEPAADYRDVDRGIRVPVGHRGGGVILIVHQDAMADIVDDVDVEQPDPDRPGRRTEPRPRSLGRRIAHGEVGHREIAATRRPERRAARVRSVERGSAATNRQVLWPVNQTVSCRATVAARPRNWTEPIV